MPELSEFNSFRMAHHRIRLDTSNVELDGDQIIVYGTAIGADGERDVRARLNLGYDEIDDIDSPTDVYQTTEVSLDEVYDEDTDENITA